MENSNNSAGGPTNEAVAGETTETPSEQPARQTGFCHVCNHQVSIIPESFTCAECNGGFIELIETPPAQSEQQRRTLTTSFLNDGVIYSFFFLQLFH